MRRHYFCSMLSLGVILLASVFGCGTKDEESSSSGSSSKTAENPVVVIETSLGNITVKLDTKNTPVTVENFLRYAKKGFYDQTIFHQVVDGYMVLGGGFTTELVEKSTDPPIRNEADVAQKNLRGTISMARHPDVADSAASQFFFNVVDSPSLDHQDKSAKGFGYCVFGTVTEGLDVVDKISKVKVKDTKEFEQIPVETVLIKSVRVLP